jgi:hypothetical protein
MDSLIYLMQALTWFWQHLGLSPKPNLFWELVTFHVLSKGKWNINKKNKKCVMGLMSYLSHKSWTCRTKMNVVYNYISHKRWPYPQPKMFFMTRVILQFSCNLHMLTTWLLKIWLENILMGALVFIWDNFVNKCINAY